MAQLRIYNDIVDGETADMIRFFGGDAVSFSGVDEFIDSIAENDERIDLRINCRGGLIDEAWTIYDALRATGKQISAEVIGEASSAATILLCAAAKGSRTAHPNAKFLFHYPFVAGLCEPARSEDLRNIARDLTDEETRLLDLYVERTGCDRAEMDALMREDRMVDATRAKELGFIDTILAPKSASRNNHQKTTNKMTIKDAFLALGTALGITGDVDALCMELETADGGTLRLRKESGDVAVGDDVDSPDGEYLMPDGRTIVVEGGKVTEVRPAAEDVGGDPLEETTEEKNKEIGDLEAEVERLHREIEERDERIAELERALEEAGEAIPTDEEKKAIAAVNAVGGVEMLRKMCSSYDFEKRDFAAADEPKNDAKKMSYREFYESRKRMN